MNKIEIDPDDFNDPTELLEAVLDKIIPDAVEDYGFADPQTIIVQTDTGRMFLVESTDEGSFLVSELNPKMFNHEES